MRAGLEGLASPHPLAGTLPAMLREDAFARSLCASLDEVLAPVLATLDGYAAYLDPALTPDDLVPWLAQWVGLAAGPGGQRPRQRQELAAASAVNAVRGTRRSLELAVEAASGVPVEVVESGGARWSPTPGGALPGEPEPSVTVVVRPPAGTAADGAGARDVGLDRERLAELVRSLTPAHVRCTVRVESA